MTWLRAFKNWLQGLPADWQPVVIEEERGYASVEGPRRGKLARSEAPADDAPPDQWIDWLAAHGGTDAGWHARAGEAYRTKWLSSSKE